MVLANGCIKISTVLLSNLDECPMINEPLILITYLLRLKEGDRLLERDLLRDRVLVRVRDLFLGGGVRERRGERERLVLEIDLLHERLQKRKDIKD